MHVDLLMFLLGAFVGHLLLHWLEDLCKRWLYKTDKPRPPKSKVVDARDQLFKKQESDE